MILTPNRRLSATLLKQSQASYLAQGKHAWLTPQIMPITSWLQKLWENYAASNLDQLPLLLSPEETEILWEETIRHSTLGEHLLQPSHTAELTKSAWDLLKSWRVSI